MHILHIIGSMNPRFGGPGQAIRNSIPELNKFGVCNEVACLDDPSESFLRNDSFKTYALGPSKGPWRYSAKLSPWLLYNLNRFDVVIVHGIWLYHSYAINKALRANQTTQKGFERRTKIFIMPHGMLDPYFQRARGRKLKAIRNWIYWKIVEGRVINSADALLFTCDVERRLAHEPFRPYYPKQETVIGLGIEKPPPFDKSMYEAFQKRCPELKDASYILYLGRIHEKKGVDLLVNAFEQIIEEVSSSKSNLTMGDGIKSYQVKLVIAGPGLETPYAQKIRQIVSKNAKLKDQILFPGMLTGDAKWGAFYGCEAFVLPSHQENFGIAVVEALACRKPVLISNQVNIWKEIENEGGGIIADNTLEGTKKLLQSWMALNVRQKKNMEQQAYAAYEKYFAMPQAAQKFFKAINSQQRVDLEIIA